MRSCERPRKRSASEALPSSVSKVYCLSIRTHGSSCRRRASSSPRCVSSFSALSSSSRAASHCSRVTVLCLVLALLPRLVFDERPQPFGRVVPLRRDLVEIPLCSLQAFAVQVPDPLTPSAGVAYQPRTPEGVEVARNRLTRHPGPFTETSNRKRPACRQASQQAEPSRVTQRGEQPHRVGQLQRDGAAITRHTAPGASSARPTPGRSCGTPRPGARVGC